MNYSDKYIENFNVPLVLNIKICNEIFGILCINENYLI